MLLILVTYSLHKTINFKFECWSFSSLARVQCWLFPIAEAIRCKRQYNRVILLEFVALIYALLIQVWWYLSQLSTTRVFEQAFG